MFINLTNHPSSEWSEEQQKAAEAYGEIRDIPFPLVDEKASESEIKTLADKYVAEIQSMGEVQDLTVHIMGEQTFCYALISKLQKAGIRCIASCTEHNTYTNEEGQKVSTFHFARFREYVPPRALRWWIRLKRSFSSFFKKKTLKKEPISWIAVVFVIVFDFLILFLPQIHCLLLLALSLLLLLLWGICKMFGHSFSFRNTVSKLLANAISPTFLGTVYLLWFAIYIGWLGNAVHGLYSESGTAFMSALFSTLVCVAGLSSLIIFFPSGSESKVEHPQKVFFSGISAINPVIQNLKPLISPLQLAKNESCKLIILYTNLYTSFTTAEVFKNKIMSLKNLTNYAKEESLDAETKEKWKEIKNCYEPFSRLIDEEIAKLDSEKDVENKKIIKIEYKIKFENEFLSHKNQIDNLPLIIKQYIKGVIPLIARQELSEECPAAIDIVITEAVDYDLFEECYLTLDREIKKYENEDNVLYFNLTPGTGIVGALMALMSINGNRQLYYYKQNTPINALTKADKSHIPLKSLLSQALENFEVEAKIY